MYVFLLLIVSLVLFLGLSALSLVEALGPGRLATPETLNQSENNQTLEFVAAIENSKWDVLSSSLECRLTHVIPDYGKIEFLRTGGAEIQLFLRFDPLYKPTDGQMRLEFLAPSWRSDLIELEKKYNNRVLLVNYKKETEPLSAPNYQMGMVLQALQLGLDPVLKHKDSLGTENILAKISPFNFEGAYQNFLNCSNSLATVPYKDVYRSVVFFESASTRLNQENRLWLMNVAAYAKQEEVWKIELEGHTDRLGSYESNIQLARLRVDTVKTFLVQLGVPDAKISTKAVGEARPLSTKVSQEARAKERHVRIKLYR